MGLLSELGELLTPEQTAKLQPLLKKLGIKQFLIVLKKFRNYQKLTKPTIIKWGQQIEGHYLMMNQQRQLQLYLEQDSHENQNQDCLIGIEYGRWMFQMTPPRPYETQYDFAEFIRQMKNKYAYLHSKKNMALTIPNIPFLGLNSPLKNQEEDMITKSKYVNDKHIANHSRFFGFDRNIHYKRGCKPDINAPLYIDKNTNKNQIQITQPNPNFIYMDAVVFGFGISSLQNTFSTKSFDHARYMYDQLNIISPLFLAATAGTPFFKGKISNWDVRWKVLSASLDQRSPEQRNPQSQSYLRTPRYCPSLLYIWSGEFNKMQYNDLDLKIRPQARSQILEYSKQMQSQIDKYLLEYIAHLFNRGVFNAHEKFKSMTQNQSVIYQMQNSTNWGSVRLKNPSDDTIGWRVQLRTMEVQLTAEQNAAFSLMIHFFTRVLHMDKKINLYLPMSLLQKNFQRASSIDAVTKQKFYFRTNIFESGQPIVQELTLHEIFFGMNKNKNNSQQKQFIGLFKYVKNTLLQTNIENIDKNKYNKIIQQTLNYLQEVTTGKRLTLAKWMRNYVNHHPKYTFNSILPKQTMDDMLIRLYEISKGSYKDQNFRPIYDL